MSSFFVTGTDTNVGKTVVSRALIQALQATGIGIVGFKPIACGEEDCAEADNTTDYANQDNLDVRILLESTQQKVSYTDINSYTFTSNSLPVLAALDEVRHIHIDKIDNDLKRLTDRYESVLVEGTYGWLTPMNKEISFAKWVQNHQMPVVLVVGIKEGCVNHALLTAQSIKTMGVPFLGWVANRVNPCLRHYAEIIELLKKEIDSPLLGEIPYIHRPEQQELGHYITNMEQLAVIKQIVSE